jgi:pyridoxamine 5'-phosphate oxidase family protein
MASIIFSQKEIEYIKSQRLARIATAAPSGTSSKGEEQQVEYTSIQPDVVPVGFDFDDDLKSIDPWDPRGIKVYGTADVVTRQGGYMEGTGHANPRYIRIKPDKKWSWGIEEPVFVEGRFNVKRANILQSFN